MYPGPLRWHPERTKLQKMNPTEFFASLGASLKNSRWSWGSVRAKDGTVFLRVWQDQCKTVQGRRAALVDLLPGHLRPEQETVGRDERRAHLALVRSGATCYMVMCEAKDVKTQPRKIKEYNDTELFIGGILMQDNGGVWLEIVGRVPVRDVVG